MHADDMKLLREFATVNSEAAFATLVQRHINLVYSVALRRLNNPHEAEEVTQVVFVILAKKAGNLRDGTILSGWLYHTAWLTSANHQRALLRRQRREQEAYMQFTQESEHDQPWQRLSPLLEEAMRRLGQHERAAVVLRFFENRTIREVAEALGLQEAATQKRVNRATEKLRTYFVRHGVQVSTTTLIASIGTSAVQTAPVALTKSVTVLAMAKGIAASGSTLTLIKTTLKLMAWTKTQTAIVAGVVVLLAAGTTTVTVKEIQDHRTYPWQVPNADSDVLRRVPPQVGIAPARFPNSMGGGIVGMGNGQILGIAQTAEDIVASAYGQSAVRMIFPSEAPPGQYDFIANLPSGNEEALKNEIKRKFGLVGRREMRDTDVLLLEVQNPNAMGLQSSDPHRLEPHSAGSSRSGAGYFTSRNQTLSGLAWFLESHFKVPIIDQTGLTNRFDIDLNWDETDYRHPNLDGLKRALLDQLGLELVPTNMPVEMLVVEKGN